ncbi:hypothetical protein J132_06353 [Termitomyces sp. J132]|nr:hypothetical protein H2248_000121 [Termitomyces sp. 'cryptogamus']KNZ74718.1 hypothetical protein J132_06353 [Termitomyces sp. J132]
MSSPSTVPPPSLSPVVTQQAVAASPISEIPIDILLAIFETLVLAWDAVQIMPILLSRVCTRWRDCVVNSPTLWSTIRTYEVLDLTTVSFDHEIKRVKTFLMRSKGCLLTIDIAIYSYLRHEGEENAYADSLPEFHARLHELSQALRIHAHRIKSLMLVVDEYQSTASILSSLKDVAMPMLAHWDVLSIYDQSWGVDDEDLEDEEVHAHSVLLHPSNEHCVSLYPNLRSVSLHAVPHHWSRFSPSNLVMLEIKMIPLKWRPSAPALMRILRANAHSLERLMLSVALPPDAYDAEVIPLPNLELIEFGFTHTSEVISLINAIEVPNLRVLMICDSRREYLHPTDRWKDSDFDAGITDLFAVIASRFPLSQLTEMKLRHIALCPMPSPTPELLTDRMDIAIDFFCRLENLNFLAIYDSDFVTLDALNRVKRRVQAHPPKFPVPKLTFLQITDTRYKILQHFLWQRLGGSKVYKPLDSLVITMPSHWYQTSKWDTMNTKRLAQEVFPLISWLSPDEEQQLAAT